MNIIESLNNAIDRQIASFLEFIEESDKEIKRHDLEIIRLTANHFACLLDGEPEEMPNTCSSDQYLTDHLVVQRRAEPLIKDRDEVYSSLVTSANTILGIIRKNIEELRLMLAGINPLLI